MVNDYQAYVFHPDGTLRGDFEALYAGSLTIPWHQDQTNYNLAATILLTWARSVTAGRLLDVGCGLGYLTSRFQSQTMLPVTGWDISPTATRRARLRFHALTPPILFETVDIRTPPLTTTYSVIVARDLWWYVIPDHNLVRRNLRALLAPNGSLLISQSFPDPAQQRWGKDVWATPQAFTQWVVEDFRVEERVQWKTEERSEQTLLVRLRHQPSA